MFNNNNEYDSDEGSLGPDIELPIDDNDNGRVVPPPSLQAHFAHVGNNSFNSKQSARGSSVGFSVLSDADLKSIEGDNKSYESGGGYYSHGSAEQKELLAKNETKAIRRLRVVVLLVLLAVATIVCFFSYRFVSSNQNEEFVNAFTEQATQVLQQFQINAQRRVGAIENLASSITSHARHTNSTWPNVTLPDFERRAGLVANELAKVMSIILVPVVTDSNRNEWEEYSVNNQDWFQEGMEVGNNGDSNRRQRRLQSNSEIPPEIYRVDGLSAVREKGPGPFLPQWQIAPIAPAPALVNFNMLSHEGYKDSLNAVLESEVTLVGRSFDFSDPTNEEKATAGRRDVFKIFLQNWEQSQSVNKFQDDPIADLHVPVYDDFHYEENRKLVGLLTCVVYWRTYFVNILPENTSGIKVVLANSCDQEYTYQINGIDVVYVGPGDQHNTDYDHMEMKTLQGAYLGPNYIDQRNVPGSCLYSIRAYPTEEFESAYTTTSPILYTCVLVFIFLFTSVIFLSYNCLVERRQRVVMDTAAASSAIVSSLFPKQVRDRLYEEKDADTKKTKSKDSAESNGAGIESYIPGNRGGRSFKDLVAESQMERVESSAEFLQGQPIADLFNDCTVLFADIAGFTSWSSGREPGDVFGLLETLYGAFDKIAKNRRVFKVETIGDW